MTHVLHRFLIGAAAAALLITQPVLTPTTATALEADPGTAEQQAPTDCPADTVCFYSEPNYQGQRSDYYNPRWRYCGVTPITPSKSVWNNDDQTWAFFDSGWGCYGTRWEAGPGQGVPEMDAVHWG
ncbi:peptidase inhibitor family I36 protein [Streptomyces sp. 3N207]|uniref:peptidase inhibitor family I36 protein n=1 Tax=Streptomyces sp. 3N207 TaxID=3457417 RepID=UPI003FCFAB5A